MIFIIYLEIKIIDLHLILCTPCSLSSGPVFSLSTPRFLSARPVFSLYARFLSMYALFSLSVHSVFSLCTLRCLSVDSVVSLCTRHFLCTGRLSCVRPVLFCVRSTLSALSSCACIVGLGMSWSAVAPWLPAFLVTASARPRRSLLSPSNRRMRSLR